MGLTNVDRLQKLYDKLSTVQKSQYLEGLYGEQLGYLWKDWSEELVNEQVQEFKEMYGVSEEFSRAKMSDIKYVWTQMETTPVEPYLTTVHKTMVFLSEHFDGCDNIEEIRDKFLGELNPNYVVDSLIIKLFKNETCMEKDEFEEMLQE